ncbi:MAG: hypothetical protein ACLFUE_04735, partial [Desulfobacteraceae bacterium]
MARGFISYRAPPLLEFSVRPRKRELPGRLIHAPLKIYHKCGLGIRGWRPVFKVDGLAKTRSTAAGNLVT